MPALLAKPAVIKRVPKMKFIEASQEIELFLGRWIHWAGIAHAKRMGRRREGAIGRETVAVIGEVPIFQRDEIISV
ncbi:MAG: hypothetical protein V7609_743 [Verrucomicrobiota bacterium]